MQLNHDIHKDINAHVGASASLGLRVLALASKTLGHGLETKSDPHRYSKEGGLVFQGLISLYDPPRPDTALPVRKCGEAGSSVHVSGSNVRANDRRLNPQIVDGAR